MFWQFLVEEMLFQLLVLSLFLMLLAIVFKVIEVHTYVHEKRREVLGDLSLISIVVVTLLAFTMLFASLIEMMQNYMMVAFVLFVLACIEGYWLSKIK